MATALSACSIASTENPTAGPRTQPPNAKAFEQGIKLAFAAAKLTGNPEVSAVRPAPLISPGEWVACMRAGAAEPARPLAVFFDGETFKSFRVAVMIDECDSATYAPLKR